MDLFTYSRTPPKNGSHSQIVNGGDGLLLNTVRLDIENFLRFSGVDTFQKPNITEIPFYLCFQ